MLLLIYYWYGLKWTTTSGAGTSTSAVAHISSFLGFNSSWWRFQSHYCPLLWLKVCGIKVMSTVSWCVVLWLLVMQYLSSPPGGALFSKYPHIEIYTICAICKNNVKMLTTKTLTYQSEWNTQRAVYRCPCTLRLATSVLRVLEPNSDNRWERTDSWESGQRGVTRMWIISQAAHCFLHVWSDAQKSDYHDVIYSQ